MTVGAPSKLSERPTGKTEELSPVAIGFVLEQLYFDLNNTKQEVAFTC